MRTKIVGKKKVNIITLGCSKNLVDSEVLMGQLKANDFDVEHEGQSKQHQTVIINTCGFIDNAKQESVNTILEFAEAKKEGQVEKLYVTGCLSQRYKSDLEESIPDVDAYFGTNDLPRLLRTLNADYKHELIGERLLSTPAHYAYLKISEGCDKQCAFCAIPLMRGKHVSKPVEQLVKEAESLARNGTKELILIAQDLTHYGQDIYKERKLPDLLRALSDVDGIEWIRMHYAYPTRFPLEVFDVMNERENVCNYLDMPLQHISDNMLKAMRRGTNKRSTYKLIENIRKRVPGIGLRTTLMVGFPGETEQDFEELCAFVQQARLDRVGVFTYSHEESTHAFGLKNDVPEKVKQERAATIMNIQQEISGELNEQKIGKIFKVLFDRAEGGYFIGRTAFDSPEVDNEVLVKAADNYVRIGDFSNIKVTEATEYDLCGVPAQ